MQITMKIEGMMCEHCQARVKKAIEAVEGVTEAAVDYRDGSAVVTLDREVAPEVLKNAVEEKNYTVLEIA